MHRNLKLFFCNLFLFFFFVISLSATDIIVFHTNDVHGRAKSNNTSIGYAKISAIVESFKKRNNALYLDAGDAFQGDVFANLSRGESILDILNAMPIDAMAIGNHEFDYGRDKLDELIKKANFPILSANIVDSNGKKVYKDHIIKEVGGVKIGIFGLTTPEATFKTHPKNIKGLTFLSPKQVAEEQVAILKKQGADIIIALTHLGIDDSTKPEYRSSVLAKVKGLDLVVDGHSHTNLPHGLTMTELPNITVDGHSHTIFSKSTRVKGESVFVVQAGEYSMHLGKTTISINGKYKQIKEDMLDKKEADNINAIPNKKVLNIINIHDKKIAEYNKKNHDLMTRSVGYIPFNLNGERADIRSQETKLGDLIADSVKVYENADIGFMNSGGIRDSIHKGYAFYKDIFEVLPFDNQVVGIILKGSDIKQVLETSVEFLGEPYASLLQVSGIIFDVNLKEKKGNRVSNILINGIPIKDNSSYKVAVNDFLSAGGDKYSIFKGKKVFFQEGKLSEVLFQYLKRTDLSKYKFSKRIKSHS